MWWHLYLSLRGKNTPQNEDNGRGEDLADSGRNRFLIHCLNTWIQSCRKYVHLCGSLSKPVYPLLKLNCLT